MSYAIGLFSVVILIFYIVAMRLFSSKENKFLGNLAKEISCSYKKPIIGTGKIRGNYKNQEIEIGIYEGLGNFVKWFDKALFLFSSNTREIMRDERILGIKVTIDKVVGKSQKVRSKMVVVGNHIFYIVKGESQFSSFSSEDIKETKIALAGAIEAAKRIELR